MSQTTTGLLDVLQSIVTASGDSGNAPVLMMLGTFKFSVATAVFREYVRTSEYRWAAVERFGQLDDLQYTGPGPDTITLPGTIYPDWKGGVQQVDTLRAIAATGVPQRLIPSQGNMNAFFVIERIKETQAVFKPDGTFRKQEFEVSLRMFSNGAQGQ